MKTWKPRSEKNKTQLTEAVDSVRVEGTTAVEKWAFLEKKLIEYNKGVQT